MSNRTSAYSIPPARKVSPLRQRMIDDMTVRNLAPNTMLCYLKKVNYLARYFGRSPQQLGPEEIREYLLYLARDRKVSVNSRLVAATALRFLYKVTLKRERVIDMLPTPRKEHHLPVILSPAEVLRFLETAPSYCHHVVFSTMYGSSPLSAASTATFRTAVIRTLIDTEPRPRAKPSRGRRRKPFVPWWLVIPPRVCNRLLAQAVVRRGKLLGQPNVPN
jgi:integrase